MNTIGNHSYFVYILTREHCRAIARAPCFAVILTKEGSARTGCNYGIKVRYQPGLNVILMKEEYAQHLFYCQTDPSCLGMTGYLCSKTLLNKKLRY